MYNRVYCNIVILHIVSCLNLTILKALHQYWCCLTFVGGILHCNISICCPAHLLDSRHDSSWSSKWCQIHVHTQGENGLALGISTRPHHLALDIRTMGFAFIFMCISVLLDGRTCQSYYLDQCSHSDLFLSGFGFWVTHSIRQLQPVPQQL